jgi:hypothetical protein
MTQITDALDDLFSDTRFILDELGDQFTSQQFLRIAIQRNQRAYIDLLAACRDQNHPFNVAHKQFGKRLKRFAEAAGYTHNGFEPGDFDIFGGPTDKCNYTRHG